MNKWQVDCFGDGEYWAHKNLTLEQANEILDDLPIGFMGSIVPMEEDGNGE